MRIYKVHKGAAVLEQNEKALPIMPVPKAKKNEKAVKIEEKPTKEEA